MEDNKGFDINKPHDENVKISIDSIIGQKTTSRRARKTEDEIKKAYFKSIITNLVYMEERQIILAEEFEIDIASHNAYFFQIVDDFFAMLFNKEQINMINFYLYDRYTPDGSVMQLQNDKGKIIPFETPEHLWEVLKTLKNG